jgi:hypothetical protein
MTVISKRKQQVPGRPVIAAVLLALLAGCGSSVPLTETRPAAGTAAVGAGPLWTRQLVSGAFKCDEGQQVDIKMDEGQRDIVLKWKGSTYVMQPVNTSTGALRFEDRSSGLVWLQIPAKSMLLNAKIGQQLANECKV